MPIVMVEIENINQYWDKSRCNQRYESELPVTAPLSHCGLVTPHGDIDLDPHWPTVPHHYLQQFWIVTSGVLWHVAESNFTESAVRFDREMHLKITILELFPDLPRANLLIHNMRHSSCGCLMIWRFCHSIFYWVAVSLITQVKHMNII